MPNLLLIAIRAAAQIKQLGLSLGWGWGEVRSVRTVAAQLRTCHTDNLCAQINSSSRIRSSSRSWRIYGSNELQSPVCSLQSFGQSNDCHINLWAASAKSLASCHRKRPGGRVASGQRGGGADACCGQLELELERQLQQQQRKERMLNWPSGSWRSWRKKPGKGAQNPFRTTKCVSVCVCVLHVVWHVSWTRPG